MSKLARACEMSLDDWFATFPDVIPEAEFSKKHEKWKANLFNKMRDGYYHRFTTKTVKVIWVAAVLFTLLLTAFVIPSSREFVLDNLNDFSIFRITEDNQNLVNGEIVINYLPVGFQLEEKLKTDYQLWSKYCNNNDDRYFIISKNSSSTKVNFNTEFSESEELTIDNITYIYNEGNKDVNVLIWTKNDYIYRIDGMLSKEELIKIANAVE